MSFSLSLVACTMYVCMCVYAFLLFIHIVSDNLRCRSIMFLSISIYHIFSPIILYWKGICDETLNKNGNEFINGRILFTHKMKKKLCLVPPPPINRKIVGIGGTLFASILAFFWHLRPCACDMCMYIHACAHPSHPCVWGVCTNFLYMY